MNTTALTITGITFLLFITIYIISSYSKKKKKNLFLGNISRLADIDRANIGHYDIWHDSIIGMDDSLAELYFLSNHSDDQTFQKVPIPEIKRCWLNEVSRVVSIKGSNIKVVEKVELKMENRSKSKPETVIEFFNQASGRLELSGELQLADKWCKLINNTISAGPN